LSKDWKITKNNPIQYPCYVENRFECPYEKGKGSDARFNAEDLFEMAQIALVLSGLFLISTKPNTSRIVT